MPKTRAGISRCIPTRSCRSTTLHFISMDRYILSETFMKWLQRRSNWKGISFSMIILSVTVFTAKRQYGANLGHDWIWTIARQMRRYRREGYPVDNGLYESGVILRRNTDKVSKVIEYWWLRILSRCETGSVVADICLLEAWVLYSSMGRVDYRFARRYFRIVNHPPRQRSLLFISKHIINRLVAAIVPYSRLFLIK